jgi:hypothetical protein
MKATDKRTSKPTQGAKKPRASYADGFQASYLDVAYKLALLGLTEEQTCGVLNITRGTFDRWLKEHQDFAQAVRDGRASADGEVVKALFKRALGYSHPDVDIRVVRGAVVQTEIIKHYPPDTVACIYWLNNRQRGLWSNKVEARVVDGEGNDLPVMDPHEVARRLCFVLAQADAQQGNAQETGNGLH